MIQYHAEVCFHSKGDIDVPQNRKCRHIVLGAMLTKSIKASPVMALTFPNKDHNSLYRH